MAAYKEVLNLNILFFGRTCGKTIFINTYMKNNGVKKDNFFDNEFSIYDYKVQISKKLCNLKIIEFDCSRDQYKENFNLYFKNNKINLDDINIIFYVYRVGNESNNMAPFNFLRSLTKRSYKVLLGNLFDNEEESYGGNYYFSDHIKDFDLFKEISPQNYNEVKRFFDEVLMKYIIYRTEERKSVFIDVTRFSKDIKETELIKYAEERKSIYIDDIRIFAGKKKEKEKIKIGKDSNYSGYFCYSKKK